MKKIAYTLCCHVNKVILLVAKLWASQKRAR